MGLRRRDVCSQEWEGRGIPCYPLAYKSAMVYYIAGSTLEVRVLKTISQVSVRSRATMEVNNQRWECPPVHSRALDRA